MRERIPRIVRSCRLRLTILYKAGAEGCPTEESKKVLAQRACEEC